MRKMTGATTWTASEGERPGERSRAAARQNGGTTPRATQCSNDRFFSEIGLDFSPP
ncbi:hypothetical protein U1Q18_007604, partial [Sarracenia purpurea var. burkii]